MKQNQPSRKLIHKRERRTQRQARKASHVLPRELCVVYVPGCGYVSDFEPGRAVVFVDYADLARVCCEHTGPRVAMAIRQTTGMRAVVRAFKPQQVGQVAAIQPKPHA